jgi:hypothetical protein
MYCGHYLKTHKLECALLIVFVLLIICFCLKQKENFFNPASWYFLSNRYGQMRSDVGQSSSIADYYERRYENLTGIEPSAVPKVVPVLTTSKTDILDGQKVALAQTPIEFESTKLKAKSVPSVENYVPQYSTEDEMSALVY